MPSASVLEMQWVPEEEEECQLLPEVQVEMQVQMASQLHARVCCGAAVRVHGGTWGCDPATRAG